jgi:small subunit ribosomal protein S7
MRKQKAKKRYLAPDPVYGDPLITRFVNNLMIGGKKSTAYTSFL